MNASTTHNQRQAHPRYSPSEARTPTLRPGNLVEAKADALFMQCPSDQITPCRRDVGVLFAEDLGGLDALSADYIHALARNPDS